MRVPHVDAMGVGDIWIHSDLTLRQLLLPCLHQALTPQGNFFYHDHIKRSHLNVTSTTMRASSAHTKICGPNLCRWVTLHADEILGLVLHIMYTAELCTLQEKCQKNGHVSNGEAASLQRKKLR